MNGRPAVVVQGNQRFEKRGALATVRNPQDLLAHVRAELAGPEGSADAGHHSFMIARRQRDVIQATRQGISATAYERELIDTTTDVLADFNTRKLTSPSGRATGKPQRFHTATLARSLRKLATCGRSLLVTEADLPGMQDPVRLQAQMSRLRRPFEHLTRKVWIASEGEKHELGYTWRPPGGWSYVLLFPQRSDV